MPLRASEASLGVSWQGERRWFGGCWSCGHNNRLKLGDAARKELVGCAAGVSVGKGSPVSASSAGGLPGQPPTWDPKALSLPHLLTACSCC